jgi:hypothetical protein
MGGVRIVPVVFTKIKLLCKENVETIFALENRWIEGLGNPSSMTLRRKSALVSTQGVFSCFDVVE